MYEVLLELDDLLETLTYWLSFAAVALSVIVVAAYVWHKAAEQKATRVEPRKRSAWPMRMAAASGWKEREPSEEKKLPDDRRGEECA